MKKLIALGTMATMAAACGGDDTDPVGSAVGGDDPPAEETDMTTEPEPEPSPEPVDTTGCGGEISGGGEDLGLYCEESYAPPNCNISSFENGLTFFSDGTWGDDMSLTGETFTYGTTAETGEESAIDWTLDESNAAFVVTGEVYQYAGWGFSFGPCVDATHWDGLQVTMQADLGGEEGQLEIQLQSNHNYPTNDGNGIGSCTPSSEETQWDECSNNKWIVGGVDAASSIEYRIPFEEFTGGSPNDTLDARQLRAVQFQLNCGDPDTVCNPNISIYDLRFYMGEPDLGPMPEADEATETTEMTE